ncbi:MAG: hypothetical protein ACTSPI_04185 [Candidatus Heimdallarchaeaceae archaeon]
MSDEEFLNSTPREVNALFKIHYEIYSGEGSKNKPTGYIDQIF